MDVHSETVMNPIAFKPHDGASIIGAVDTEATTTRGFAADVISGLSARHKHLPPKYFYDATGSRLFEEICRTAEYYVTRSETILLGNIAAEVAAGIPHGAALVEVCCSMQHRSFPLTCRSTSARMPCARLRLG
jgi:uncharacterized SAM-dependent methyltransferase